MDVAIGRQTTALRDVVPDMRFVDSMADLVVATRDAKTTADVAAIVLPRVTVMFDVSVAFWEFAPAARRIGTVASTLTPDLTDLFGIMASYGHRELWLQQFARSRSPVAVRYSDHATMQQLDRNPLVQEMYLPLGIHDVAQGALRCEGGWITCLQLQATARRIPDDVLTRFEAVRRVVAALLPPPSAPSPSAWVLGGSVDAKPGPVNVRTLEGPRGVVEGADGVWWLGEDPTRHRVPAWGGAPGLQPTARQIEVMRYVAQGLPDKSIGRRLGITTRGVQKHLANVMTSTGAHNRTEAAVFLTRQGIV